jgi:SH3 domain protein
MTHGPDMKKLLLIFIITNASIAGAQTMRYVTDQLEITMRSGKSTQHQVIRVLPSGTPLELLEVDTESGYSRVRSPQGIEGWVISRYLDNLPSGRERLVEAEKKLANLNIENNRLQENIKQLTTDKNALEKEKQTLTKENHRLDQELTRIRQTAASALAIDSENKSLKERFNTVERNYQTVQQENEVLKDRSDRDWFVVGAGVILLGIGIGLVIPKIRWRRKSSWDSL